MPANIDTHTHTNIHTHIYSGLYIYILFPRTPILTKQRKQKRISSFPSLARFRIRLNKSRFHHFRLWSDPESDWPGRSLDIRRARNEKFNLKKVRRNETKTIKKLVEKWGNREVAANCKLVVWASRHEKNFKLLCWTEGSDGIHGFNGASTRSEGAKIQFPLKTPWVRNFEASAPR